MPGFSRILIVILLIVTVGRGEIFCQQASVLIRGKVLDQRSQNPIEYATVIVIEQDSQSPVSGTTSLSDGSFELRTDLKKFRVKVTFLGFEPFLIDEIQISNGEADLGVIHLVENSQTLDQVVVRAEKSTTEFKLDKRVFNVGQDISSTGASALEVLNNVPSVSVNIEGQISLRGSSGVQILINGKPSILASDQGNALGTITADMLERIEVITNPSAKYEAEGTSGIINIVIKKEESKGINGSATVNTGIPNNHSVGLSLNRRSEKFNLFSQIGIGHRTFPEDQEGVNFDKYSLTGINHRGHHDKNETFYNLILGTDYHIDDLNVLSLTGHFAYEIETEFSDVQFTQSSGPSSSLTTWDREESTDATNPKWQYDLQYKKDFEDDEEHVLLMSAQGSFFGKDQSSEFSDISLTGTPVDLEQQSHSIFKNAEYTFKTDYTKPFSEVWMLETGGQYVLSEVGNDYTVRNYLDNQWVSDPGFSNNFDYNQKVLGVYGTGAYEGDVWGLKLGLRLENTDLATHLTTTDQRNEQNYTNLFPSLHTSYKFSDGISLQAGYSSRIFRPRMWDLNPFSNIRNNFNIRTGNPELEPEFTDSYELTSIFIFSDVSMNFGVYHRYTTQVVERVSTYEDNVNYSKPVNVGTNHATGLEFNAKYSPWKFLSLNGDFNYNYFNRQGELEGRSFDFKSDRWTTQVMAKLDLAGDLDIELTTAYESGFQTVQSQVSSQFYTDIGIRKKILKGRGVINLSVRDIFANRVFESETDELNFYLYSKRQRGRFALVGFSYGFGKGEAMEFAGQKQF